MYVKQVAHVSILNMGTARRMRPSHFVHGLEMRASSAKVRATVSYTRRDSSIRRQRDLIAILQTEGPPRATPYTRALVLHAGELEQADGAVPASLSASR